MNYVILPLSAIEKSIYPLETIYKHRWIRVVRDAGCVGAAECSAPHFISLLHGTCRFSRIIDKAGGVPFLPSHAGARGWFAVMASAEHDSHRLQSALL